MSGFGKGATAGLACVGLGESIGAAAVYFVALLLTALLTAVLVQAANAPLVEELETRIRMLREFACCGCGHKLGRHRNPHSADGYGCLDCNCQAVHRLDEGPIEPLRTGKP